MHEKRFKELNVFANPKINNALDDIYGLIENNFGPVGDRLSVCGSVARIMDGILTEDYTPKDVDLVCSDNRIWRFLQAQIDRIPAHITKKKERFILYYDGFCIEIWMQVQCKDKTGIFKQKIHYSYADKN